MTIARRYHERRGGVSTVKQTRSNCLNFHDVHDTRLRDMQGIRRPVSAQQMHIFRVACNSGTSHQYTVHIKPDNTKQQKTNYNNNKKSKTHPVHHKSKMPLEATRHAKMPFGHATLKHTAPNKTQASDVMGGRKQTN